MRVGFVILALLVTGCSRPAPVTETDNSMTSAGSIDRAPGNDPAPIANPAMPLPSPVATAAALPEADYLGRWIGVEGMFLNVTKRAGGVTLEMQWDLDHKGQFDGTITPEGLRFTREGVTETARFTDGDATGLKYLAGKTHCLTVKPGEGYCRK